jgi:hypothetical protein
MNKVTYNKDGSVEVEVEGQIGESYEITYLEEVEMKRYIMITKEQMEKGND